MPTYEKRYRRDGVLASIQCIRMKQCKQRAKQDMHYHDYTELLFGVSGCANAWVGTNCYSLTAGSMLLVHNHVYHTVDGNGEPSEYIVVKFLPSVLFSEEQGPGEYAFGRLFGANTYDSHIYFDAEELQGHDLQTHFLRMMTEWDVQKIGYQLSLRADVMQIVLEIIRIWQAENPSLAEVTLKNAHSELIGDAMAYVGEHYADLTEEKCARALGVSAPYLSRIFKKGMQTTFAAYLNRTRLKAAEKLLVSGDMSMTEIAELVGFSTVSHFIANFRACYRVTPAKYRRILRGEADAADF